MRRVNIKKFLLICLIAPLLTSCSSIGRYESPLWHMTASDEEKLDYFEEICAAYGYNYRTPEMSQCVTLEKRSSSSASSDRFRQGLQDVQSNMDNRFNNTSTTTDCRKWGSGIKCNSY